MKRPTLPARYAVAILGCVGIAMIYGLRVNVSAAMVAMVNHTALEKEPQGIKKAGNYPADCPEPENASEASVEDGPFLWSRPLQGTILSSYYWGYIVAQLPGGRVAEVFSSKWVLFFAVALNVVCTLLTPLAAKLHYAALITARVGEGIGGGVAFPAMHVMLAHWAPPGERSVMSSVCYAGTALGTVISTFLVGVITKAVGWEAIFYIQGGACVPWLFAWSFFVSDTPQKQKYISERERAYITASLSQSEDKKAKPPVPWRSVFASPPFWAILIAHTCNNWGWYMVLIELPYYMKNVLRYNIAENTALSAMPFLLMWVFSLAFSKLLDATRNAGRVTQTGARKISTALASVVPTACLMALCYVGCRRELAVCLMTVAIVASAGMFTGYVSNHIDIAPNFAGTLFGLTNTVGTVPGIVVPLFVGWLTKDDPGIASWRIIFWVTVGFYAVEFAVFTMFASGEEQPWNRSADNSEHLEARGREKEEKSA